MELGELSEPPLDSMTDHYIRTVVAILVSVKQRRGPKTRVRPITYYHAYRKYIECLYTTDTSVFRTRSTVVVLATVLAVTNNIRVFI